jgi:plasmid stabilization system protein ParE
MRIVYTRRAEIQIAAQLGHGIEMFGRPTAARTIQRLRRFIRDTVGLFPRASNYLPDLDVHESWVPGTPFVVFYRYAPAQQTVTVLAVFHHRQDRSQFEPD